MTEISLSGTPLQDFDVVSIHHLPRLSVLWLNNTGIGTEAFVMTTFLVINSSNSIRLRSRICHLVSLRRSLTELYIGANPRVTDDVVTPLLMLSKLSRLSLVDTSASLMGLRRLAVFVDRAGQAYSRVHVSPEWINYLSSKCRDHIQIGVFAERVFLENQVWRNTTSWRSDRHLLTTHRVAGGFPLPRSKSTYRYKRTVMRRRWRRPQKRNW